MPFYDLKCSKCSMEFNIMAKLSERESGQITCPDAEAMNLRLFLKVLTYSVQKV